jgi:tripartite-type tricarboxylate transporter receptor subunit TctC
VPTIAEAGVPGYEYSTWYGLLVPAATPRAIVQKLNAATVAVLHSPETQKRYVSQGMDPIPTTPEQFTAKLRSETDKWVRVVKATGARAE